MIYIETTYIITFPYPFLFVRSTVIAKRDLFNIFLMKIVASVLRTEQFGVLSCFIGIYCYYCYYSKIVHYYVLDVQP
jgi:hypothetical protein